MSDMSRTNGVMMMLGGMAMVLCSGVIMACTLMADQSWIGMVTGVVPFVFLVGAVMYVVAQYGQRVSSTSITVQRLYGIQFLSGICFIVSGLLMIENFCHILQPFVVKSIDSYYTYIQIVHNNWVVTLLIGAVLQMYTVHRLSSELRKES